MRHGMRHGSHHGMHAPWHARATDTPRHAPRHAIARPATRIERGDRAGGGTARTWHACLARTPLSCARAQVRHFCDSGRTVQARTRRRCCCGGGRGDAVAAPSHLQRPGSAERRGETRGAGSEGRGRRGWEEPGRRSRGVSGAGRARVAWCGAWGDVPRRGLQRTAEAAV